MDISEYLNQRTRQMDNIFFILMVLLWCLSTGLREGSMWTNKWKERLPIGYHFWRVIEMVAIIGMLVSYQSFSLLLGTGMLGMTMVYERALQYIQYQHFFYPQKPWKILKWEIQFTNGFMVAVGILGFIIIFLAI